jgi:hypothetical protein
VPAAEEEKSAKPKEREGRRLSLKKKMGLGLGFFVFFLMLSKLPPLLKIQYSMVFIGRVLLGFQISPSTFPFLLFSSFFVNFDFSYFFVFLKASKYQHRLNAGNQ